ncbi:hypothetical protein DFH06DRAFT_1134427 [Mycena polygramma]|nr:hypothetical protein DFH06DRAFT_1134427 [Mycena polygramma]
MAKSGLVGHPPQSSVAAWIDGSRAWEIVEWIKIPHWGRIDWVRERGIRTESPLLQRSKPDKRICEGPYSFPGSIRTHLGAEDLPPCLQPVRQNPSSQASKIERFPAISYNEEEVGNQETKTVRQDTYLIVPNTGAEFQVGPTYRLCAGELGFDVREGSRTHEKCMSAHSIGWDACEEPWDYNKVPNLGIGEELGEGQQKDEPDGRSEIRNRGSHAGILEKAGHSF